jgi:hypothetical protein
VPYKGLDKTRVSFFVTLENGPEKVITEKEQQADCVVIESFSSLWNVNTAFGELSFAVDDEKVLVDLSRALTGVSCLVAHVVLRWTSERVRHLFKFDACYCYYYSLPSCKQTNQSRQRDDRR